DAGSRALVAELMSIRPENLAVESRRLFRPHVLVVTNVRLDHREEMGWTKPEIARSLAFSMPPESVVFVSGDEGSPDLERAAASMRAKIIRVEKPESSSFFDEDRALAEAVAGHFGIPSGMARRGFASTRPDFGGLQAWEADLGFPPAPWILVSAFAANEPDSSERVLAQFQEKVALKGRPLVGVLNFRPDRGDRTLQWLDAQKRGFFAGFRKVYVVGAHIHSLAIRKKGGGHRVFTPLSGRSASTMTNRIVSLEGAASVLVGLGNMGGIGAALVEHWQDIGRIHAL
ncbi:MAG: hypothetical protein JXE07_08190, partial [Candidatus Aminicenantes bacterium]|nr:hypothetical protein [Candidatus Aminicenantes bacterium]